MTWVAAMGLNLARAQEPALKTLTFTASTEDFPNPERGFHRYREAGAQNSFDIRKDNNTLIFLKLRADAFRTGPLGAGFLANFQAACDQARKDGVKLIPRLAYNDGPEAGCPAQYGCDAPKAVVMGHIAQLAPFWKKNKDVIHILDPGFIGGWGEWHTSSNGLDNKKDMTDILYAILDSLPADRMVYVRYPRLKRDIFAGSGTSDQAMLTPARAFDGSRNSRTGHLNDCYLSGEDDVGTYRDFSNGWPRSRELAFIGTESQYTPMGGETCALHQNGSCANALKEMADMHIDNLNRDFHTGVIQGWKDQGCYDAIARRIGYRFTAESARLPDSVRPGGLLEFSLTLRNEGFGELFNPRIVEVTLSGPEASPTLLAAALPDDPRLWTGGKTATVTARLSIPALAEGTYVLGLRLADKDKTLASDPRYSIRLANQGLWNATVGVNELKKNLEITAKAPGAVHGFIRFEAIGSGVGIRAPRVRPDDANARPGNADRRATLRTATPRFGLKGLDAEGEGIAGEVDARGRRAQKTPKATAAPGLPAR
jgi:hypothetical protein